MNKIYNEFINYSKNNFKRNLSWLDRDTDSPTHGSFDRNYWHYKITDFNSDILQQGIYTLISLYKDDIPNNYNKLKLKKLIFSVTQYTIKSYQQNSSFNEYYPNEDGYPPLAFISNVLGDTFIEFPEFLELKDIKNIYKKINLYLSKLTEFNASNQYAIGIAGLYKFLEFFPDFKNIININFHLDNILKLQDNKEGWFNEYDGFDLGYLSVTLEALSDIYEITENNKIKTSIDLIIDFVYKIIDKNGQLPFTINSRNTEYFLPYGLVKNLSTNNKCGPILNLLFNNMDTNDHFIKGNDDRYHSHYIFSSILKCLPHLKNKNSFAQLDFIENIKFENAGIIKKYFKNYDITIYVGLKKGGIIRVHDHKNQKIFLQNGFRAMKGKTILTNNFQSKNWKFNINNEEIICEGYFIKSNFIISSPVKHFLLRLASFALGNKIIKFLKRLMIFNKISKKHSYKRKIKFKDNFIIEDIFVGFSGYKLKINPKQNLRHVASADIFSEEDFCEDIIELNPKLIQEDFFEIKNKFKFN